MDTINYHCKGKFNKKRKNYFTKYVFFFLFNCGFMFAQENIKENNISLGLLSTFDSMQTSLSVEFGTNIFNIRSFQVGSLTTVTGAKIYDETPNLFHLGLTQKFTFGKFSGYNGAMNTGRYGFVSTAFGFMSFDKNKESKFLFDSPYYWEIGGGAGFNIWISPKSSIVLETGGGMHMVFGEGKTGFPKKLLKTGYARMSLGSRFFF